MPLQRINLKQMLQKQAASKYRFPRQCLALVLSCVVLPRVVLLCVALPLAQLTIAQTTSQSNGHAPRELLVIREGAETNQIHIRTRALAVPYREQNNPAFSP
jgi:hypothetical protein